MNLRICGLACVIVTMAVVPRAFAEKGWQSDLNEAKREAQSLQRPILCHFGATWCGPCQKMERTVLHQDAITQRLEAEVVGLKVDIDQQPELAKRFGVTQFPTDVFLEPDGRRLMESTGYHPLSEYADLIDRAGRRYQTLLASRRTENDSNVLAVRDSNSSGDGAKSSEPMLMLEGFCPVTLQQDRKWKKGSDEYPFNYRGQIYHFVSKEARDAFAKSPLKFVPQVMGCDPVIVWSTDRAIPGSIEWGAYYDDHLYLFANEDNRRKFKQSPDKYTAVQVVIRADDIESVVR